MHGVPGRGFVVAAAYRRGARADLSGHRRGGVERVRVAPLTQLVPADCIVAPALLKVDVQGYELEVLKGCGDILPRCAACYVECSFVELYTGQALAHEVIDWLHARGFKLARIGLVTFASDGLSVQADLLFLPHGAALAP